MALLTALAASLALVSGNVVATAPVAVSWTQLRYDPAHNGFNPLETALSTTTVKDLKPAWSTTGDYTNPLVAGGLDITAGLPIPGKPQVTLFARNATTGATVWSAPFQTYQPLDPAVGDGGALVYVVADAAKPKLRAFNITNGTPVWNLPLSAGIYNSPTVAGDVIYVSSNFAGHGSVKPSGEVLAINAASGKEVWSLSLPTPAISSAVDINGMLYVDGKNQRVFAIGALKGKPKWSTKALFKPSQVAVGATMAGVKGRLFVAASNDRLYALNAGSGHVEWSFGTASTSGNLSLAVAYKTVYVGGFASGAHAENPNLYALNGSTGKVRWKVAAGDPNNPSIANGIIYLTNMNGVLFAVDAKTGKTLWKYTGGISAGEFTYPAIVNGMVYVNGYGFALPAA